MKDTTGKVSHKTTKRRIKFWKKKLPRKWIYLIVMLFMAVDALTLVDLMIDLNFMEEVISILLTGAVAVVLDGTPVLISHQLQQFGYCRKLKRTGAAVGHLVWAIFLTVMLLGLFILLFILRWEGRGDLYGQGKAYSSFAETDAGGYQTTRGQDAMSVFLGLLPIATSIFSFALTYRGDLQEMYKIQAHIECIHLDEEITESRIALEHDQRMLDELREMELDAREHQLFEEIAHHLETASKLRTDIAIMIREADPDCVTRQVNFRLPVME